VITGGIQAVPFLPPARRYVLGYMTSYAIPTWRATILTAASAKFK